MKIKIKRFEYNSFKNLGWQYKAIHFLQKQVDKKLNKFINCFFIHGSFVTKDFLEDWSDLDAKVIFNYPINPFAKKLIKKLSLICYKIDPLTHHLFSIISEDDLKYYSNSWLPPSLYKYSLLLNGKSEIVINLKEDKGNIERMRSFIGYFRDKVSNGEYSKTKADWKNDVAHILLWPSFLLQAKGIVIYKKYSFERVKKEFSKIDFSIVDQATQIRKNWRQVNLLRYYPNFLFLVFPFRLNQIIINRHRKYLNRRPKQTQEEIKVFTQNALLFLEKSYDLILKDEN